MKQILAALLVGLLPTLALANMDVRQGIQVLAFTSDSSCQHDKPELDRLRNDFTIREINDRELMDRYGVKRLPTYVVMQDGVEVDRTGDVAVLTTILAAFFFLFCL